MKRVGEVIVLFAGLLLLAAPFAAIPASASVSTGNGGSPGPDGIFTLPSLPYSTTDQTDYSTTCPGDLTGCTAPVGGTSSWSSTAFAVPYTGTLVVTITDCCYEGDYYQLWQTTDATGLTGWTLVGTTQQVNTGSQLTAPSYDPTWTGTGTQYSSTTFSVPVSGTTLFAVRDVLFDTMVSLLGSSCGGTSVVVIGCSATGISVAGGWSPAGFDVSFATGSCLSSTTTFTDGSSMDVSVSGAVPVGACPTIIGENLFGSQPVGTTDPGLATPNYYDLQVLNLTGGTAHVCLTGSSITSGMVIEYWDGSTWVSVPTTFTPPHTVCGDIPVTALDGTPLVIGTPTSTGVPEFSDGFGIVAVALAFVVVAWKAKSLSAPARW